MIGSGVGFDWSCNVKGDSGRVGYIQAVSIRADIDRYQKIAMITAKPTQAASLSAKHDAKSFMCREGAHRLAAVTG